MPKIRKWIHTGYVGANHEDIEELPDDWDSLTEEERAKVLDEVANEYLCDRIDFGAEVVD